MRNLLLTCFFSVFTCSFFYAQNWTGNVDSDWNNSANWSTAPSDGDDITINPANYTGVGASPVITTDSNFSADAVTISNGGQLTINASFATDDDFTIIDAGSSIIFNSGTLDVGDRLIVELGASMTINDGNLNVTERFIVGENSIIDMEGGSVNSGQRLILDGGGIFNFNDGNITVGETMAMADGSITNSCQFNMNGGSLTVNGEFELENEAGDFAPTFNMNAGTFLLNGDMFWFGEAPGTGTPQVLINGGNTTVTGIIQNMPLSTVNMYLKIDGDANFSFDGSLIENIHPTDSIFQTGNSNFTINNTNSINNAGGFLAENVTTTFNGNTTLQGTGTYEFHDLLINPGMSLDHQNPTQILLSGDFMVEGTFNANSNTVILTGNESQAVSSSAMLELYSLTVQNSSAEGIELFTPLEINGHLQLNMGVVHTSSTNLLTVKNDATASNGNPGSFVSGPLQKTGDDAFVFPIGKNNELGQLGISAPSDSNFYFQAEYFNQSYTNTTPTNLPLTSVSSIEYWELTESANPNSVQVSLYYDDAMESAITDCDEFSIAQWNGSSWDPILATVTGTCSGNESGYATSNTDVTSFGIFTFGFFSNVTSQNVNICEGESYTVGTNTYTTTGTYVDVIQDDNGNDITMVTHLYVFEPNASFSVNGAELMANVQFSDAYQWMDCNGNPIDGAEDMFFTPSEDGSYSLWVSQGGCTAVSECYNYITEEVEICEGDSYTVGNNTYTEAGTYGHMYEASGENYVSITNLSVFIVDTDVSLTGTTLSANNANAQSYQWIDCDTGAAIPNEEGISFQPTVDGNYAVEITDNGCTSTSECINVAGMAVEDQIWTNLSLYPNPTESNLHLNFGKVLNQVQITIYDIAGRIVKQQNLHNQQEATFELNSAAGLYFVELKSNSARKTLKFVKK